MLSKTTFFILLLVLLGVGLISLFPTKANASTFEEQVVTLINEQRQKQNLSLFTTSDKLSQSATTHNNLMATCSKSYGTSSCFKHQVTILGEQSLLSRVQATGYAVRSISENIAWGQTTPSAVVTSWMGSSGHKANILGNYKDIGCGYIDSQNGSYKGMFWTCNFGSSQPTSLTITPTRAATATPTSRPAITMTPTPTTRPSLITPTPTSGVTQKPWWCVYVPDYPLCK